MIGNAFKILLALIVLGIGFVRRPQRARCSPNEYVEGVRRDGSTWCVRAPSKREIDCRGARACYSNEPPSYTQPLQIYCANGQLPIVVDERTVRCQARH